MKIFHICTITNNLIQYKEMRASFIEAGFDENRCRYSLFDNSKGNIYDPYQVFNHVKENISEPYIIFCHQDILLNQGHGFDQLMKVLKDLDEIDPSWAIVGNAGCNFYYEAVVKITDPNSTPNWPGTFPQGVHSLDENFLVIKSSAKFSCSTDLSGFHFYATDLCLNAISNRYSCYVIDFHITHLSGGTLDQFFRNAQAEFYEKWCSRFGFCYIRTMTGITMCLSKYKIMRLLGTRDWFIKWIFYRRKLYFLIIPKY